MNSDIKEVRAAQMIVTFFVVGVDGGCCNLHRDTRFGGVGVVDNGRPLDIGKGALDPGNHQVPDLELDGCVCRVNLPVISKSKMRDDQQKKYEEQSFKNNHDQEPSVASDR